MFGTVREGVSRLAGSTTADEEIAGEGRRASCRSGRHELGSEPVEAVRSDQPDHVPGAGSRRESRRYDRRARASPRVRARVRGSSLGDASPITQLDFRCVSRPRVLPNGATFPDRTELRENT